MRKTVKPSGAASSRIAITASHEKNNRIAIAQPFFAGTLVTATEEILDTE
jgi:hypothetical protein